MAAIIVYLECITNMHVGNGDVNYSIIDNEVERDAVTGYPTINASGVKGALREYFVKKNADINQINKIFGGESAGRLRFLNADMIAIPARASEGSQAYYMISTMEAVSRYQEKCQAFLKKEMNVVAKKTEESRAAEGIKLADVVSILGKEIHILSDEDFRKISLPVLARNNLENGKSTNLWYEEIVPHKSLFSFAVLAEDADQELLTFFVKMIDNQMVQFGGNASIGYGLCKVSIMEV